MNNRHITPKLKIYGLLSLYMASLLWGSAYIAQKILVDFGIPPFYMVGFRMSFTLIMIGFIYKQKISKITLIRGMIMGFILFLVFSLQTYGLRYLDSSVSSFISSLNLVLIPIINTILFKYHFTFINMISILIALVGVYFFNITEDMVFEWNIGMLLTLLCALVIAFQLVYANYFLIDENPQQLATLQNLFCGLFAFIFAFIFEGFDQFPMIWSTKAILAILYLGIVASVLCFNLLAIGQKYIKDLVKVGLILALQPLFTVLIAIPLLGEELNTFKIIGMLCIIGGIILDEVFSSKLSNP